ncbi:hypothetical protein NTJ12_001516 [Flavobacterium psychrophilum]|nr:hypothetical protein [Flavobacterium psychrophilum]
MSNQKNAGRKIGSKNAIRTDLRKELTTIFLDKFKDEVKQIKVLQPETRVRVLIGILPYLLPKGNLSKEESEIQEIVYNSVLPDIKKLHFYLNVVPIERKASILLSFIKQLNLTSTQQDEIASSLKNKGRNTK